MSKLPKNFPEYSILYKTLVKQIKELEKRKQEIDENENIQLKIEKYQLELKRIEKMFPNNYLMENNYSFL